MSECQLEKNVKTAESSCDRNRNIWLIFMCKNCWSGPLSEYSDTANLVGITSNDVCFFFVLILVSLLVIPPLKLFMAHKRNAYIKRFFARTDPSWVWAMISRKFIVLRSYKGKKAGNHWFSHSVSQLLLYYI